MQDAPICSPVIYFWPLLREWGQLLEALGSDTGIELFFYVAINCLNVYKQSHPNKQKRTTWNIWTTASRKNRERRESDQGLPWFPWGCQWQHAYLSEKARSHRVHGSAFMCLSNNQGSLPHACVFFVHAQAGAALALEADKTKVWPSQTGKIQWGETRRTEKAVLNFNLNCEWCWMKENKELTGWERWRRSCASVALRLTQCTFDVRPSSCCTCIFHAQPSFHSW